MWMSQSFQNHLCVVFITSIALVTTTVLIKNQTITSTAKRTQPSPLDNLTSLPATQFYKNTSHSTLKANDEHNGQNANEIIHILGLFELTTKWGRRPEADSEIAAAQLAIQHVNRLNIIPGYTLKLLINDTKCDPGVGIDTFFHAIYSGKNIIMLLGTSCSNVTESLAHIVPYWNILQISFGSTSPALSDRKKFPLFFRTVAPDSSHNHAKLSFVQHYQWKVVATFCQSENKYILPLNSLISEFENANISCVATITFSLDNYKEQLKMLQGSDIRIVIGSFSTQLAPKIFCEIYYLNMYGIDYVWILQDRGEKWWMRGTDECSPAQLQQSVDGLILVGDFNVVSGNGTSISGLNDYLFERELSLTSQSRMSKYARLCYDAIWAMALTLAHSSAKLLKQFNYKRDDIVCEFLQRMSSLNFMGISGPLKFIGADRVGSSALRQLQGGEIRDIAIYNSNQLNFFCESCYRINWHNKQTPIAQRILKISLVTIPNSIFYSIIFASLLGIAFALFFLYFNLHFRRMKTVKLSSPKLNIVAVIGCILVYLFVILLGFDTTKMNKYIVNELCTLSVYLLSAGFSLAFGSMFAKTYRIHRIFAYYGGTGKVKDKLLKDKQLIVIILVPLLIDGIILGLWLMIDPMERQLYNLTLQINDEDPGVVYQPQVEVCRSQNTSGWLVAIYGYKGIILIMGVYMAWETRHVKVQALNDSQYIGICVYSAVFSAIITVLSSFITEYVVFSYVARTLSILTATTITLFLLFLPKLKSVFNSHPMHDPIMQSMGLKIECNTRRFINNDPKEQILRLEIQNKVYRCELQALDHEISRLENLMTNSIRKCSDDNSDAVFTIYKNDFGTKLGWASQSWPDTFIKSRNEFLSENRLHEDEVCTNNKVVMIDKIKQLFDNFRRSSTNNPADVERISFDLHNSNPEILVDSISSDKNMTKAKSEVFYSKNSIL